VIGDAPADREVARVQRCPNSNLGNAFNGPVTPMRMPVLDARHHGCQNSRRSCRRVQLMICGNDGPGVFIAGLDQLPERCRRNHGEKDAADRTGMP
jgi:hypothetical protein